MPRRATLVVCALLAGAAPLTATAGAARGPAKHGHTIRDSPYLWATVNACDTTAHPDTIGIRASMPGTGIAAEEMFVRFQLQYRSDMDGKWHNLGAAGDSGFIDIGSGRYRARATGRFFTVVPSGDSSTLRGAVTFEWRKAGEVVRRQRELTQAGHPHTANADPPDHTAAQCTIVK